MSYFKNAGHACVMTKKGHTLINLWKFEDEISLNSMQIQSFWSKRIPNKIKKGHCVRIPDAVSV